MDMIEMLLAKELARETTELVDSAVKSFCAVRETLLKMGVPRPVVEDMINDFAEYYTALFQNMTLDELKNTL